MKEEEKQIREDSKLVYLEISRRGRCKFSELTLACHLQEVDLCFALLAAIAKSAKEGMKMASIMRLEQMTMWNNLLAYLYVNNLFP